MSRGASPTALGHTARWLCSTGRYQYPMSHRSYHAVVLLALLLISLCPAPAQAQPDEATLRIVVTSEETGSPLQGAYLALFGIDDAETTRTGVTNADGYYAMRGLTPGRYRIEISYVGYRTHRDTLAVEAGRRVYNAALDTRSTQLGEVTVEAEHGATQREAGLQTIRAAEIGRIPTPGPSGDLASYLQTLPGVVSVGDRGGQLFIRGGAPSQNRYLVDGLPIIQPFHISSFYSAFPQNIVQSADLYAGGFGAKYAEALSAVLDVRLRPGDMNAYGGSAAIGPHLAAGHVEGPLVEGNQSFLVSGRYSLIEETGGPLLGRDTPLGFYDVTGRYSMQKDNASCNITAMRTHDRGSIGPNRTREFTWSNTILGGRCLILDERFGRAFTLRGGYTGFRNTAGTVGAPEQIASRWRLFLAFEQDQILLGLPAKLGGLITGGRYDATIDEPFVDVESLNRSQDLVRVHGSVTWSPSDHLTVTPSLAAQVPASRLNPILDPRLRVKIRPDGTDQQEISLAGGLYHQIDEAITDQREAGTVFSVWRPPNFDTALPRALHAIAGYRQRLGSALEISVEGYTKRLYDILVSKWTPEAALNTETARADGLTYGADARLVYRTGPLYAYLGYGWSKVRYEAATDDLGAWVDGAVFAYNPSHDRRHQLNALASYTYKGFTSSVSWEFGSGRPYTKVYGFDLAYPLPEGQPLEQPGTAQTVYEEPYGARLPVYHRLDVSVERTFDLSDRFVLDAKVGAINVYDRSNIFYYDINALQRVNQTPLLPYVSVRLRAE